MDYGVRPIGVLRTPFTALDQTPIQASRSTAVGQIEVFEEFASKTRRLETVSARQDS